jgi:hypothetical protein
MRVANRYESSVHRWDLKVRRQLNRISGIVFGNTMNESVERFFPKISTLGNE